MSRTIHVGLLFNYALSFYRDILRGVRQFTETQPDWAFLPLLVERGRVRWRGNAPPDGILATLNNRAFVDAVTDWDRPLVNVSAVIRDLRYPRVAVDNRIVGRLAAQHFLERGLGHFAFVGHPHHFASEERERSYCDVIRSAGHDVHCYYTPRDRPFDPDAREWYLDERDGRWLQSLPKPVGVFVPGDMFGAALTQICRELDLRIPEDVAVVGVDNDDLYCHLAQPPLSSVMVNAERIGYEAAALLSRLLLGGAPPREPILISPEGLCVRRSSDVLAIDDEDMCAALRFIRENAHLSITVGDVVEAVATGRRSLERRFQRALGRGLADEICRTRLERSKRLLAETDLSIPAVARQTGFSTARRLHATFRREFGESPSQFRRQTRIPQTRPGGRLQPIGAGDASGQIGEDADEVA